jgi:hypothetical protein
MMFGQPETLVATAFCVPGKIERISKRLGRIAALGDRCQIEYRKGDHNLMLELNLYTRIVHQGNLVILAPAGIKKSRR